jgi:hypothetical protein
MDKKLIEYIKFKIKDEQELARRDEYYRARVNLMKHLLDFKTK